MVFVIAALHYSSAARRVRRWERLSAVQQYSITPGWSGLLGLSNKKFTVCNKAMRRVPYKQRYGTPACKTAHCLSVNRVVNGPPPIHAFLSARSRMWANKILGLESRRPGCVVDQLSEVPAVFCLRTRLVYRKGWSYKTSCLLIFFKLCYRSYHGAVTARSDCCARLPTRLCRIPGQPRPLPRPNFRIL